MTKVFHREYYDRSLIIIDGHTGFEASGKDIVCAGISALVCTLINVLKDEESDGRLHLKRDIVRDGYVCFEIEFFDFSKERVKGILDAVLTGLYIMHQTYPDYVKWE